MKIKFGILLGAFLYVLPFNIITTPMGLYSGYLTGIAQIIRTLLIEFAHVEMSFDWTGIILYIMNIPLLILAYYALGKKFFIKTIITITLITTFFSLLPVPTVPIITDYLTGSLVAGLISGYGAGLILRCGGSGGGMDILGMYYAKKNPNFSVGQVSMIVAAFVFCVCALLYPLEIVVYSVIFTAAGAWSMDRAHHQNIKISVIIISSSPYVGDVISCCINRSATCWEGKGAYTQNQYWLYITAVSYNEAIKLKHQMTQLDPNAFMIFQNVREIAGRYKMHF